MPDVSELAAPPMRRLRILVALVFAVSFAAIAAVAALQSQEHDARTKETVARIYAVSVAQTITDLVPPETTLVDAPPPVLAGLIRRAAERSVAQLETIRALDPGRAAKLRSLVIDIRDGGVGRTQAARQDDLARVKQASQIANEIAQVQHARAVRAENRSLLGSGLALAFAISVVVFLVFRDRRRSLAEASALTAVARRLADRDSLTDLPNRRRFDADLDALVPAAGPVEIAVCDLNGFKEINDRLGHDAGDAVLITVARDLQVAIDHRGTVYRTGGDEFCIISAPGARVAEAARHALEREGCLTVGSVGAATFSTEHPLARDVVRQADRRMYEAKRAIGHPGSDRRSVPRYDAEAGD